MYRLRSFTAGIKYLAKVEIPIISCLNSKGQASQRQLVNDSSSSFRGPRRFGGPKPFRLAPVTTGQEYDVKIQSMSRRGDSGIAKIQGLVVFVTGVKLGDSLRIRITKVGSGFATGEIVSDSKDSLSPQAEVEASTDRNV